MSLRIPVAIAAICALTACSDGGAADVSTTSSSASLSPTTASSATAASVSLTVELSCLNTHVFVMSADETMAVGLIADASGPGTIQFDASSSNVEFMAYRGSAIRGAACDGGADSRPSGEPLKITSGSGTLTLDSTTISGTGDHLTTTELRLSDGTIVAPIDIALSCAGCFPS